MELPLTGKVVLMPLICTEELAIVLATDERAGAMRAGVATTQYNQCCQCLPMKLTLVITLVSDLLSH